MKIITNILLPFICVILLTPQVFAERTPLDKIEAIVNQDVILTSDILNLEKEITNRYTKEGKKLPKGDDLKKQLLDKLISDSLQLEVAKNVGLRINDAQLNQTVHQLAADEGLTVTEFRQAMEKNGSSYKAFLNNIRNELTINEIRQIQVRRRINISDQEIKQLVEKINEQGKQTTKFHFVHILLKTDNSSSITDQQTTDSLAKDLINKINQGEDVNALAVKYSQGPKALQGGDWGWRTINEIPTLFANVFDDVNTKKDDLIGPFRSKMGLHIIKIIDKQGSQNVTTTEVNVRHILLKSNVILSDQKAESLLNKYRQEILSGKEKFSELAQNHSQDPGSAIKGGELGWSDPRMYVDEFRDMTISLPVGEISKPFKTTHGWHIVQVLDRRDSDTTAEATKQKAYSILFQRRFPAEAYAWLNEIRQKAYIKINNPNYIIKAQ